ncbi:MAG: MarR family winged helix-turn-helix transcriptional regulator [Actinobacteria bacterium]|nr:MarR family winged helix-turn-helix transcriptional regulator [Actinomycetota bacterium]
MERPELAIAPHCVAARLRLLNRAVTGIYDRALRAHGLKTSQLNVLVAVATLGRPEPGDIARLLHIAPSTLSRNAERMRAAGWLDIAAGKDGRSQTLSLTAGGAELLNAALPAWEQAQEEAEALLGEATTYAVLQAGDRLLAAGYAQTVGIPTRPSNTKTTDKGRIA